MDGIMEFIENYWFGILLIFWAISAVVKAIKEAVESYKFNHSILRAVYSAAGSSFFVIILEIIVGATWIFGGMKLDNISDIFASVCFVLAVWIFMVPHCYQAGVKNAIENGADETEAYSSEYIRPEFGAVLVITIILTALARYVFVD